jgi:hypothetical protein
LNAGWQESGYEWIIHPDGSTRYITVVGDWITILGLCGIRVPTGLTQSDHGYYIRFIPPGNMEMIERLLDYTVIHFLLSDYF